MFARRINTVSVHAEGAHNEVIVGGVLDVPGRSMFEKARHLEQHRDELRQFLLHEPRGKVASCVNLVLPSCQPGVDAGFIIMESASYPPMSGTNTISTVTALLETGVLPMTEPETNLVLETPGGLIRVRATCTGGKCVQVRIENVPCFVFGLNYKLDVEGLGVIRTDVAYGGMIYAMVDVNDVGLEIEPKYAHDLVEVGERIKAAAAAQVEAIHPVNRDINTVNQTLFAAPLRRNDAGVLTARNAVVVSPGRLDRSPCGTGTSARLAIMHAKGEIAVGELFDHESIIGTHFIAKIESATDTDGRVWVHPSIIGRGWVTGFHSHVLSPSDPLPTGYRLTDTWPDQPPLRPATLPSST